MPFTKHKDTSHHREAVEATITLPKSTGELLNIGHSSKKAMNQRILLTILSKIRFHGRQAIPLRSECDESNSNFQQLLHLRAEDNTKLNEWMQIKTDTYTSPEIQNEMTKIISLQILHGIAAEIQSASLFTLMVGEATDVSICSKIVIRWVSYDWEVF